MKRWWMLGLVVAVGCKSNSPCEYDSMGAGMLKGTLDNEPWTTDTATWGTAGTGLFLSAATAGGHELSMVLQRDVEGTTMNLALSGKYPIDIALDTPQDGTVTFRHSTGNTMAGQPGGWMVIDRAGGGVLEGCFDVEVKDQFDTYELQASIMAEMAN